MSLNLLKKHLSYAGAGAKTAGGGGDSTSQLSSSGSKRKLNDNGNSRKGKKSKAPVRQHETASAVPAGISKSYIDIATEELSSRQILLGKKIKSIADQAKERRGGKSGSRSRRSAASGFRDVNLGDDDDDEVSSVNRSVASLSRKKINCVIGLYRKPKAKSAVR